MADAVCGCCDRGANECDLREPLPAWREHYGLPDVLCSDCMKVWYERGEKDPKRIKEIVLGRGTPGARA